MRSESSLSLEDARKIITASEKKAQEIGQPMNVAVVDVGGNLLAFERMEGAWLGSIDICMKKAFTSRAFDIETAALAEHSQPGTQFYGIHASNNGKIMIFAGGIPIKQNGRVVGAIGVSGGSGKQDQAVAEAGAKPSNFPNHCPTFRRGPRGAASCTPCAGLRSKTPTRPPGTTTRRR